VSDLTPRPRTGGITMPRSAAAASGKRAAGLAAAGLNAVLGSRAAGRPGILVYHRVADPVGGVPAPTINVPPGRFRAQLAGLLARGFVPRPLTDLLDRHAAGEPVPPRTFVVTFDDGYENVYTRAWPVLRDLGVPATVFVNTAFLGSDRPFPFDAWGRAHAAAVPAEAYRPLTVAQCREMAAAGLVDIGAHTHTHADFRGRPADLGPDLRTCADAVRAWFGPSRVTFAFPFGRRALGYVTDDLLEAARGTGVACALTTEAELVEPGSDPFGWGRFNAYSWDTGATLAAKLGGWYRGRP
jgi:peptidoglycan/xylan/chitin deacetylase (PgdA/CDA1 family)